MEISAGRLHLLPWTEYDADELCAALQDPQIQHWTTVPSPYTREHAVSFVARSATGWEEGSATWAVREATTGDLLASVALRTGGDPSIGWWCAAAARGQGVTTDAVRAVCRWGFGALDLPRITWTAEVGNHASRAVAQKCGFHVEGVRRAALVHRGERVDAWVGTLLRSDEVVDTRPLPRPPVLTDGVVTLRGWTPSDAPEAARACDDPLTAQWLPVPKPYTLEDAQGYISGYIAGAWADGTAAELAVTDAVTGELLGAMGLKLRLRSLRVGEVGYWTAPWARGLGAAGRGAALIARWGLDVLGLVRVELYADVENTRSQAAALKAGFLQEGVAVSRGLDRAGQPRDMIQFALCRKSTGL